MKKATRISIAIFFLVVYWMVSLDYIQMMLNSKFDAEVYLGWLWLIANLLGTTSGMWSLIKMISR